MRRLLVFARHEVHMAHYSEEKNGLDLADEKSDGKEGDNDERDAAPVQAVKSFFYENQDFADIFEVFANENAHHIDLESEEYQLVYTELHEEFVRIFEEQMEGFIESQGSSAAEASAHSCSVVCRFGLW